MKRREIIKNSILITGGAMLLSGCSEKNQNEIPDIIKPKQTATYNMSMPLPFNNVLIDGIYDLNKKLKKSKITTLYNSIPEPLAANFDQEFQASRGYNPNLLSYDAFAKYVNHAQDKGFKFVYTMNSPKPFSEEKFNLLRDDFFKLLDFLYSIGCHDIKVANTQLLQIINIERPKFNLHLSTSFEYHNISQFINIFRTYNNIKSINLSIDDNRNFQLLKALRKKFPDVELEIMVNEMCLHGCPARISHPAAPSCNVWDCFEAKRKMGYIEAFFKSNVIYPWDLGYYSAIGINSFKFMSYDLRANLRDYKHIVDYLYLVDNGIKNISADDFFNYVYKSTADIKNNVKLSEIKKYFPDMKHFIQKGDRCSDICGIECNYCLDCAKKIKEIVS